MATWLSSYQSQWPCLALAESMAFFLHHPGDGFIDEYDIYMLVISCKFGTSQ